MGGECTEEERGRGRRKRKQKELLKDLWKKKYNIQQSFRVLHEKRYDLCSSCNGIFGGEEGTSPIRVTCPPQHVGGVDLATPQRVRDGGWVQGSAACPPQLLGLGFLVCNAAEGMTSSQGCCGDQSETM